MVSVVCKQLVVGFGFAPVIVVRIKQLARSFYILSAIVETARRPKTVFPLARKHKKTPKKSEWEVAGVSVSAVRGQRRPAGPGVMCSQAGEVHAGWEMTTDRLPNVGRNFD